MSSSEIGDAEDVLKFKPDNKQLKSFLQGKYHYALTMQDVRNLKRKVKSWEGISYIGKLNEMLDAGKGKEDITVNDSGVTQMIAFATNEHVL